jgi:hypothetical protein
MEYTEGPGVQEFRGKMHPVPPGTKAKPRPKGKERPTLEQLEGKVGQNAAEGTNESSGETKERN